MKTTFGERLVAYLALISGLSISAVAVYYSVVGLTSIFAAAVIPIVIMGTALEISKLVATVWLKQNWRLAPVSVRAYLIAAIVILMMITSMGIFGYLSKAHLDQNLVSGDVEARIAVYDEKIKIEKDIIDADRKIIQQFDESVDQVMARSTDEKGADKAVAIRRSQQKERSRIGQEIAESQRRITALNEERAPIAAEVRKVEAEVGPIKYIAAFFYGTTDQGTLERAVTWVIITLIVVFDPLAVILLLASQISFQRFNQAPETESITESEPEALAEEPPVEESVADEILCNRCGTQLEDVPGLGLFCPNTECLAPEPTVDYQFGDEVHDVDEVEPPMAPPIPEAPVANLASRPQPIEHREETKVHTTKVFGPPRVPEDYVQNEEQSQSSLWSNTVSNKAPE